MEKYTFANGLTVALIEKPDAHSAAVCFYVAAGNRFETADKAGVSHFIEHMVFKGTETRSSIDISEESDLLGGQLNAYTAKEYTCFYSRALCEHLSKTLHLMCDMLCNPLFDTCDIETEKGVILEEIGMYDDSPEDRCADMLTALCYDGKPLGFNILGTRQSVSDITADDLRGYMSKFYVPERTVIALCGNFDRDEVLGILDSYFGSAKNTKNPLTFSDETINGGITLYKLPVEQTQLSLSFSGLSSGNPLRHACSFFSSISGGAASSRINRRIREELGLAYSVYTFSSSYLGTGMFGLSGGLAHANQEKFLRESLKILKEVRTDFTETEIERTREQFKASTALSNESLASIAASAGRQLLLDGEYTDIDGILDIIRSISVDDIREAALLVTNPSKVALSVVGKPLSEEKYNEILDDCLADY